MSPILPSDLGRFAEITRSSPIFAEKLEPWAVEWLSHQDARSTLPKVLASILHRADANGYAYAPYRETSVLCGIGQPAVASQLKLLRESGLVEKIPSRPPTISQYRLLCLRGGAE